MQPEGAESFAQDGVSLAGKNTNESPNLMKVFKNDFDAKYNIVDMQTPLNAFMSGQYKRSYAYYTLRNRLPVVLTRVLDTLTKEKSQIVEKFAFTNFLQNARDELKIIIGMISRLKYELQTDKAFHQFKGDEPDRELWNNFISQLPSEASTFYRACWMHAECYMYRKLHSFVENSIFLKQLDLFANVKQHALTSCQNDILALAKYTRRTENNLEMFSEILKISLWSNRNDLSADERARQFNIKVLDDVNATEEYIIDNHTAEIWKCLSTKRPTRQHVDFVLDNAGYELFADFILAEYIIEKGLASKVRFHVKAHPWYVSDVTERDVRWTLEYLSKHTDYIISLLGNKFLEFLAEGKFEIAQTSHFWTSPYAFQHMRSMSPQLYKTLSQSKLIIFKGDLNYRKLLSDVCWDATQEIRTCLGGFVPSNLCAIRTIKAEVICGISEKICAELNGKDPQWMLTGHYGLIQYVDGSREFGY
ncbi:damage-control phosphatase ARMT1 isoform X1 [Drosophila busckii]|uniref:damage-control phosphatase ARMT1 isoform X1 n=2 Tax=Drosophila busckii TaxID=30019 RepID=UPI00083ED26D|nr:damage-control phosphatase ARMT1 isoform X1 [Drosophila busckii]